MLWSAGNIEKKQVRETPGLFHAYAVVNGFSGYDRVVLNLVCSGRRIHFNFYDLVVEGFSGLHEKEKLNIKKSVDLLFSKEETESLREFFHEKYGYSLQVIEEPLPIPPGKYREFSGTASLTTSGCDEWKVYTEPGYSLPFRVTAFYDLRGALPVMEEEFEEEKNGSIMLDKIDF